VEIFPVLPQVDDRVPHQLTRPVKSDVASPLDFEDLNAPAGQLSGGQGEASPAGTAAERDDGLVFHQEEKVLRHLALDPSAAEAPLQLENLTIGSAAEVVNQ
jgi:hypothetical protein